MATEVSLFMRQQIRWPERCTCCGGNADSHMPVQRIYQEAGNRQVTWSANVPYCSACKKHVGLDGLSTWWILLIMCSAPISFLFLAGMLFLPDAKKVVVLTALPFLGVGLIVLVIVLHFYYAAAASKAMGPTCTNKFNAVRIKSFGHLSTPPPPGGGAQFAQVSSATFEFDNADYARLFKQANAHNL